MSQDNDLSNFSMLDLFKTEVENQVAVLNEGLLALEKNAEAPRVLETLMRAAHSLKGAARIVQIDPAVRVAHALEDCFVAAQKGAIVLKLEKMDVVLQGIDFLTRVGSLKEQELNDWITKQAAETEALVAKISQLITTQNAEPQPASAPVPSTAAIASDSKDSDPRTVRVRAENLNRLLAYAAETSLAASTLETFTESLRLLKKQQKDLSASIAQLNESLQNSAEIALGDQVLAQSEHVYQELSNRYAQLEAYSRRAINLTKRLYGEVLDSRMRPFREGTEALPRMVRDVSRQLGKKVRLEISGKQTKVDRDVLEKLEAPLNHLLRNALDHGIEPPQDRLAAGKTEEGTLLLDASHKSGMLHIQVTDDGRGVDFTKLRAKLVQKKLTTPEIVEELSESELLEFLFLPGFSTTEQVTELSGRGVGLDIVYNMVREVAGQIRCTSQPGNGMTVHLQLPVTLSLLRTLLVEIGGETYGFPLVRIDKTLLLGGDQIKLEGNSQIEWNGTRLFLASARSILDLPVSPNGEDAPVIVVSDRDKHYAIIVDGFLMQKDLVVRPLDARLGKVKNVYAASVLEDGSPVLILDVQDMLHSIDQRHADSFRDKEDPARAKRVLVVEDSMTVRDFAGQLLKRQGFDVDLAVDGMDGWNALKTKSYDMVITDLDMPRMNGTELVQRMRADSKLNGIPVVMVSYKERTEDRDKALQAGANRFLSKTSFHDESFLRAVRDLLGESES